MLRERTHRTKSRSLTAAATAQTRASTVTGQSGQSLAARAPHTRSENKLTTNQLQSLAFHDAERAAVPDGESGPLSCGESLPSDVKRLIRE